MDLQQFIAAMSNDLEPLKRLATRLASDGYKEIPHGMTVSPRPLVAPEANALYLFAPLPANLIEQYERRFSLAIPRCYKTVLMQIGGLNAFEFSLFGIPASMTFDPPHLDRSSVQPFDLGTANRNWKREYEVDARLFHFGGGPLNFDENIGYFLSPAGSIEAYRKNGKLFQVWDSLRAFLEDELQRAEADYPRFEAFVSNLQKNRSPQT